MNSIAEQEYQDDQVDLLEVFATLWAAKRWVFGSGFVAALLAIGVSLMLPNIYGTTVILAPAGQQEKMSGLASQFGGLAAIAGIDLGSGMGVDKSVLGMETLKSRAFLTSFIRRHDLVVPLIAGRKWNVETGTWIIDDSLYDVEAGKWVRKVSPPKTIEPSDGEIFKVFSKAITVSQEKKTGIVTLTLESKSPVAVKQWSDWLIKDLNDYIRRRDIQESEKSINYLNQQLTQTSVAQMQTVLYQLIEQQTKSAMLAEVREGYVFRVIDPAVVPEEKLRPKRSIIVLVCAFLGMVAGAAWVLFRKNRQPAEAAVCDSAAG